MIDSPWADFSRFLKNALGEGLRPELQDVNDFFAADAVFEFPFAPPGYPTRLEGREAIRAHLAQLPGQIVIHRFDPPTVHRTQEAGVVILEYAVRGQAVASGRSYNQRYLNVITLRDGTIAHFRDYWNPQIVLEALQA
ncbi:hypothetical protein ABS71_15150 [bacterium SCN 62-11]|nr:nuclear transport factor 2 family protein [Candidatus Eremiobacteraeota bacterium]ODT62830.1 MAG: hypothetical protein ABS71_15150 [bacterium SCN 62-11]